MRWAASGFSVIIKAYFFIEAPFLSNFFDSYKYVAVIEICAALGVGECLKKLFAKIVITYCMRAMN